MFWIFSPRFVSLLAVQGRGPENDLVSLAYSTGFILSVVLRDSAVPDITALHGHAGKAVERRARLQAISRIKVIYCPSNDSNKSWYICVISLYLRSISFPLTPSVMVSSAFWLSVFALHERQPQQKNNLLIKRWYACRADSHCCARFFRYLIL